MIPFFDRAKSDLGSWFHVKIGPLLDLSWMRNRRMDGIVVFADDSNVHRLEMLDAEQKMKWMGAISIGNFTHAGRSPAEEDYYSSSPDPRCRAGRLSGEDGVDRVRA